MNFYVIIFILLPLITSTSGHLGHEENISTFLKFYFKTKKGKTTCQNPEYYIKTANIEESKPENQNKFILYHGESYGTWIYQMILREFLYPEAPEDWLPLRSEPLESDIDKFTLLRLINDKGNDHKHQFTDIGLSVSPNLYSRSFTESAWGSICHIQIENWHKVTGFSDIGELNKFLYFSLRREFIPEGQWKRFKLQKKLLNQFIQIRRRQKKAYEIKDYLFKIERHFPKTFVKYHKHFKAISKDLKAGGTKEENLEGVVLQIIMDQELADQIIYDSKPFGWLREPFENMHDRWSYGGKAWKKGKIEAYSQVYQRVKNRHDFTQARLALTNDFRQYPSRVKIKTIAGIMENPVDYEIIKFMIKEMVEFNNLKRGPNPENSKLEPPENKSQEKKKKSKFSWLKKILKMALINARPAHLSNENHSPLFKFYYETKGNEFDALTCQQPEFYLKTADIEESKPENQNKVILYHGESYGTWIYQMILREFLYPEAPDDWLPLRFGTLNTDIDKNTLMSMVNNIETDHQTRYKDIGLAVSPNLYSKSIAEAAWGSICPIQLDDWHKIIGFSDYGQMHKKLYAVLRQTFITKTKWKKFKARKKLLNQFIQIQRPLKRNYVLKNFVGKVKRYFPETFENYRQTFEVIAKKLEKHKEIPNENLEGVALQIIMDSDLEDRLAYDSFPFGVPRKSTENENLYEPYSKVYWEEKNQIDFTQARLALTNDFREYPSRVRIKAIAGIMANPIDYEVVKSMIKEMVNIKKEKKTIKSRLKKVFKSVFN